MTKSIQSLKEFQLGNTFEAKINGGNTIAQGSVTTEGTYTNCVTATQSGNCSDATNVFASDDGSYTLTQTSTCCS